MPCQSPLVLEVENLSCAHLAAPSYPLAPHPGQEGPCLGAQESTNPSDPLSPQNKHIIHCHSESDESLQTVLQPGRLQGSQTSSEAHCQCFGPQPKPDAPVPTVSVTLEEKGNRGEDAGAAQRKKHHCGACGHLLLAVVLAIFSPLIAVGVCMADIVTGECCNVPGKDIDSVDDLYVYVYPDKSS